MCCLRHACRSGPRASLSRCQSEPNLDALVVHNVHHPGLAADSREHAATFISAANTAALLRHPSRRAAVAASFSTPAATHSSHTAALKRLDGLV